MFVFNSFNITDKQVPAKSREQLIVSCKILPFPLECDQITVIFLKVTPLSDIGQNKTNILNMKFETQDAIKIM